MKKSILLIFINLVSLFAFSQINQTLRGKITDIASKLPIAGASIAVYKDSLFIAGTLSDEEGNYSIPNLPLERVSIIAKFFGYGQFIAPNIEITSAKETIVNIELEEAPNKLNEVVVTALDKIKTNNQMATVSARLFSIDEASRYPGSRGEPSRMASNFAGVNGSNDANNDIIVRGNSSAGVLWRVEGVDIPNPNHFPTLGSTGGPVCMLNSKLITNSDFFTGAFPAEYGNANAAVFDVRFKNGNNEHAEYTADIGVLGAELSAEGPMNKTSKSSYIIAYRYSTLKLFNALQIPIGTSFIPQYEDLSFKLNVPLKKNSDLTFFGIMGNSKIDILLSQSKQNAPEIYSGNNYDEYTRNAMGIVGLSYSKSINATAFYKVIISGSVIIDKLKLNLIYRKPDFSIDSIVFNEAHNFNDQKYSAHWFINKKFNVRTTMKAGIIATLFHVNYIDTLRDDTSYAMIRRYDTNSYFLLFQPYVQAKIKLTEKLSFNAGVNLLYSTINTHSLAINPRAGLRWNFKTDKTLSFGYGWHTQAMTWYYYFQQQLSSDGHYVLNNINTNFYHSQHLVLAYDWSVSKNVRLKVETYYQYLYNVPVSDTPSSYSILNQVTPASLVNKGLGRNYGMEFTLEKFYSNNYYYMVTFSLYQSEYTGSDGQWYSTNFNGNYILNLLGGKEFKIQKRNIIGLGSKITYAGGQRYGPVDTAQTVINKMVTQVDNKMNTLQFAPYFRCDLRIYYKINKKKITHEISFDLVNIFNTQNVLSLAYGPDPNNPTGYTINKNYQLGFLPLFNYKIDF
jgi:hypothetical protein